MSATTEAQRVQARIDKHSARAQELRDELKRVQKLLRQAHRDREHLRDQERVKTIKALPAGTIVCIRPEIIMYDGGRGPQGGHPLKLRKAARKWAVVLDEDTGQHWQILMGDLVVWKAEMPDRTREGREMGNLISGVFGK